MTQFLMEIQSGRLGTNYTSLEASKRLWELTLRSFTLSSSSRWSLRHFECWLNCYWGRWWLCVVASMSWHHLAISLAQICNAMPGKACGSLDIRKGWLSCGCRLMCYKSIPCVQPYQVKLLIHFLSSKSATWFLHQCTHRSNFHHYHCQTKTPLPNQSRW